VTERTVFDLLVAALAWYLGACATTATLAQWRWYRRRHCHGCTCRSARLEPTWTIEGKAPSSTKPFPISIPRKELEKWAYNHRN
jgi:hypothetical protein